MVILVTYIQNDHESHQIRLISKNDENIDLDMSMNNTKREKSMVNPRLKDF